MITKAPENAGVFRRAIEYHDTARAAFSAFLAEKVRDDSTRVLLPAFIGWSPREGSGVFDPVSGRNLPFDFYRVDTRLRVDVDDFKRLVRQDDIVVLIHYFGYVDPAYEELVRTARTVGATILEDEAHAMFTDLVGGGAGRAGDAAIFSLHKMLPFHDGGMLVWNDCRMLANQESTARIQEVLSYDLTSIASRRRANALYLQSKISEDSRWFEPLWPKPEVNEVPQTFPILVHKVSRYALYERLQSEGFGVVALYHTMIPQIDTGRFPEAHHLAKTILNLPVHQDIGTSELSAMLAAMNCVAADLDC